MKPKLFLFGACDLHDIVDNDILRQDFDIIDSHIDRTSVKNDELAFSQMSFPATGTSLISLYTKPGPIAGRILQLYQVLNKRDRIAHHETFKEILKYPYFDFYRKNAGKNDFLIISFSAEIYTKFFCNGECFTIIPVMDHVFDPNNCLHWLYKEYFTKEEYLFPFDTKESLELSFDLLVDFAKQIYQIFEDRVILVKTHFANFAISTDYNVVKVKTSPDNLLFYRQTKIVTDPTDHNYAERLSEIIMNKFRHHYSVDLPLVKLDEPVFLDANHKWGLGQFHIDLSSREKIASLIKEHLDKKVIKHVSNDSE